MLHLVFCMSFAATNPRMMRLLVGVVDTLFKMLNWRHGLKGPAVDALFKVFLAWTVAGGHAVRKPVAYLRALQVIFYGVAQAHAESLYQGKRCVVGFLSHPKSFTKKTGGIEMPGHAVFSLMLRFLEESGRVTVSISPGNLRCSYFEPTELFPPFTEPLEPVLLSKTGFVSMKTAWEDGHQTVDPRDYTPEQAAYIEETERRLVAINDHALQHVYHVVERGVFCQLFAGNAMYHIVYNDQSIHRGGRLYNGIQNLPKRNRTGDPDFVPLRPTLHIDGKPTTEVDYSNLHFAMMYAIKGLPCPEDCYAVPVDGWDVPDDDPIKRDLLKLVFLAMPNCGAPAKTAKQNRRTGINTIKGQMKRFDEQLAAKRAKKVPDFWKRLENPEFSDDDWERERKEGLIEWHAYLLPSHVTPELLLKCLIRHHAPIADLLYSGIGSFLQSIDAKIAMRVIERFNHLGKPIVGIHDSFLVFVEDIELLKRAMVEEFEREFPGFQARVKVEPPLAGMPAFPDE